MRPIEAEVSFDHAGIRNSNLGVVMRAGYALTVLVSLSAQSVGHTEVLEPGLYADAAAHLIYVGIENEAPDPAVNEYFDISTQRTGELPTGARLWKRKGISEETRLVEAPGGALGASLYFTDPGKRPTIILIHGNDPETRQIGFLIPYFVLSGINVISYDQRGTGQSTGNWQQNGPMQRATDVAAIFDAYVTNKHVDAKRLGIWGFSNGGWTAPIVATTRPVSFMILKSGPAESLETNICYTVAQHMRSKHYNSASISSAVQTWRTLLGALSSTVPWETARTRYVAASAAPWFADSYIPIFFPADMGLPPPTEALDAMRREMLYDPSATLQKVRTPTLAIFGALDRNVDVAHAPALFKSAFAHAGMDDFTIHIYKDAGHTLKVSATGFDNEQPERLPSGYPQIMIQWLRERDFLGAAQSDGISVQQGGKIKTHSSEPKLLL
jgi:pimeloyl-ACP methyl ester carboxylesterase